MLGAHGGSTRRARHPIVIVVIFVTAIFGLLSLLPQVIAAFSWTTSNASNSLTAAADFGDGSMQVWGTGDSGLMGTGELGYRSTPTQVQLPGGGVDSTTWSVIKGGADHMCGTKAGGSTHTLWCWGANSYGQLGLGDTEERSTPTQVGAGTWTALAVGDNFTCGIQNSTNLMFCWGDNSDGQLGFTADTAVHSSPVQLGVATWTAVTAGALHACGIQTGGALYCWGNNATGEIGNGGVVTPQPTPVHVGAATWTGISAGAGFTCGIQTAGSLWCWGYNGDHELGLGAGTTNQPSPQQVGALTTWTGNPATGNGQACATTSTPALFCWGYNASGQLGVGDTTNRTTPTQVPNPPSDTWTAVAAKGNTTCSRTTTGKERYCWGDNTYGQVGDGTTTNRTSPVLLEGGTPSNSSGLGNNTSCELHTDNTLWCWGLLNYGQVGVGVSTHLDTPVASGAINLWTSPTAGSLHACSLDVAHRLYCWGNNAYGELGLGTTASAFTATQVGLATWIAVAAGTNVTCGIQTGGALYCWGQNNVGQLGQNFTSGLPQTSPIQVGVATWIAVSVGASDACGIQTGGTLYCWGSNATGEDGVGNVTSPQLFPVESAVPAPSTGTWASVAVGGAHTCARSTTGLAYCWGDNSSGELGRGNVVTPATTPVNIAAPTGTWASVAVGGAHTCGVLSTGSLYCWGSNASGQLGQGTVGTNITSPGLVTGGTVWATASPGFQSTCALRIAGTVYCWGGNVYGQLGNATNHTDNITPTLASGITARYLSLGSEGTTYFSRA